MGRTKQADNMPFGNAGAVFLGNGLVVSRIKYLAFGGDRFDAVGFEEILKLLLHHRHPLDDRSRQQKRRAVPGIFR